MPTQRPALTHATLSPNRTVWTRSWRCVACGRFHGPVASASRPRQCHACHSPAIYAVTAPARAGG